VGYWADLVAWELPSVGAGEAAEALIWRRPRALQILPRPSFYAEPGPGGNLPSRLSLDDGTRHEPPTVWLS
ncbi:hypothetical protein LCGC14_1578920, partial [marine sediment metagenome]